MSIDSSSKMIQIEVHGGKNQSCREFDWDHFYILDIEFKKIHFLTQHLEFV